jgi:acyl dehydratase
MELSMGDLESAAGLDLGQTPTIVVTQSRIDDFAKATGDRQWIHVDTEKSKTGPYGSTIAHGFLTLALTGAAVAELLTVPDAVQMVNYGVNKARFPSVVPVDSELAVAGTVTASTRTPLGFLLAFALEAKVLGSDRPCCVGEAVVYYLGAKPGTEFA